MDFTSRNEKFRSKSSENAMSIGSLILNLPPSCLEFVPISKATPWTAETPLFVVGTYDLQKEARDGEEKNDNETSMPKEQSRQGSLSLYELKHDVLTELLTFPTPSAVLDLHFFPETTIFAVASSTGSITIFNVHYSGIDKSGSEDRRNESAFKVDHIATHQVFDEDTIITYFAWNPSSDRAKPRMAITCTSGAVMTLGFNESLTEFEILNDGEVVSQHDYEAWYCAFSEKGEILYSGGDDSKLIMASINSGVSNPRKLPFHNAGVTAILPIPTHFTDTSAEDTTILLTGSYDDFIRVYQPPSLSNQRAKVIAEKDIGLSGGGVWRLKFLEDDLNSGLSNQIRKSTSRDKNISNGERIFVVLASCMRAGCKILEIRQSESGDWTINVLAQTVVHESMNYASDVQPLSSSVSLDQNAARTIVSTSFYDRLLFVWKYDPNISVSLVED